MDLLCFQVIFGILAFGLPMRCVGESVKMGKFKYIGRANKCYRMLIIEKFSKRERIRTFYLTFFNKNTKLISDQLG